ncbi:MAG: hypothetical protein ACI9JM_001362 [Halioglobus sp.]|jgi:hypothetical protein
MRSALSPQKAGIFGLSALPIRSCAIEQIRMCVFDIPRGGPAAHRSVPRGKLGGPSGFPRSLTSLKALRCLVRDLGTQLSFPRRYAPVSSLLSRGLLDIVGLKTTRARHRLALWHRRYWTDGWSTKGMYLEVKPPPGGSLHRRKIKGRRTSLKKSRQETTPQN